MTLSTRELLRRLGAGESIASVCEAAGLSRQEFDDWWKRETQSRVPPSTGEVTAGVTAAVTIDRDEWGIPRITAENDVDLFFGFGYCMAQDRLFQLDYLRRRAVGRLAEVLGPSALEYDLVVRTVGLAEIAEREWTQLPEETRTLLAAFSRGVNAHIAEVGERLPIEFDLLDYVPEEWRPQDSLAIAGEFRWYLTGRFPVIVIPELAKRALGGDGPLYRAFMTAEADEESILPPGSTPWGPAPQQRFAPATLSGAGPDDGSGSNNWVIAGSRTVTGKPLVADDPHIAFGAVTCWYEVHLRGGSFNVAGMTYAGMPGVLAGRNPRVAWGITNNICSQRDLYQERTSPEHPGCFLYDGQWEPARERTEIIVVKGQEPVQKTIRSSRNGPIVDEILPPLARDTGPVSLRWLGFEVCGWYTALLNMGRARSAAEFRAALEPWIVPTFSLVFADVDGEVGYQATGRIPIRHIRERGYREGWNPAHQWDGVIPFASMPGAVNPERGWIITANNRVAADDYPWPLSGTWVSGHRAARIREMIEEREKLSWKDCAQMQADVVSRRAVVCMPALLNILRESSDPRIQTATEHLANWDCRMEVNRVGATLFGMFFSEWCLTVARERFPAEQFPFLAVAIGGLATELLKGDAVGWFHTRDRRRAILDSFQTTLETLTRQLGPEIDGWQWGRKHTIEQKHFLSGRGDLGQLLDRGGIPVKGDGITVCNTGFDPNWAANLGAGYRMIADLADPHATLFAIEAGSASGNPGSSHYDDQLNTWMQDGYHALKLIDDSSESSSRARQTLRPSGAVS